MTVMEVPAEARAAVDARRRREIDELDYRRQLRLLGAAGYTQKQIGSWLGLTQPTVNSALKTAAKVPLPAEGFSGADPYEICQRYATGRLTREQLIDELVRWPYLPRGGTAGELDDLVVRRSGSWADVEEAAHAGLIDDGIYEEVFARRHPSQEAV